MTPRPIVIPFLLLALVGCADDAPDVDAAGAIEVVAPPVQVSIERSRFSESSLTVTPGTTVRFVNRDAFDHTVTTRDGAPVAFDSGAMTQGAVFEVTFDRAGTYDYFCEIHPTMRATVVVT